MSWGDVLAVTAVAAPIAYILGKMLGYLQQIHQELVRIRLAAESLHDQAVTDILTRRAMRQARR